MSSSTPGRIRHPKGVLLPMVFEFQSPRDWSLTRRERILLVGGDALLAVANSPEVLSIASDAE